MENVRYSTALVGILVVGGVLSAVAGVAGCISYTMETAKLEAADAAGVRQVRGKG